MKTKVKIENVSVNKIAHNHGLVESKLGSIIDYAENSRFICYDLYELTHDSIFLRLARVYNSYEDLLNILYIKTV